MRIVIMTTELSLRNNSIDFPKYDPDTYLGRCEDEIDNSASIVKREERYALAYKVGAYALATFFVVVATAAVVLSSIYLPVFLPITGISIVVLTSAARRKVQDIFARATLHATTAKRTRDIALEAHMLRNDNNLLQTQVRISDLVPSLKGNLARCIPLLAHYNYWEKQHADYEKQVAAKLTEAEDAPNMEKRSKICVELSKLRQKASQAKACQAFMLAVMQKPNFEGNPQELCSLKDFSIPANLTKQTLTTSIEHHPWTQNAILGQCGKSALAIVFRNKRIAPITFNQLQRLPAQELATRYLQAMG